MSSSRAAQAVYPELAKRERLAEAQRQAERKSEPIAKPNWAKTSDPIRSAQPAPVVDYSRVPTLRRVNK